MYREVRDHFVVYFKKYKTEDSEKIAVSHISKPVQNWHCAFKQCVLRRDKVEVEYIIELGRSDLKYAY